MKLETIRFTVPEQAIAFLGGVGACLVLLIVFYVFLTKQLCFAKKKSSDRRNHETDDTDE